ncbi:hypothetical protein RZN25_18535 [Bacillaceae bacterium S4-13-56]
MNWVNVDKPTKTLTIHNAYCNYIPSKESSFKGIKCELIDGGWFSFVTMDEAKRLYFDKYPDFKQKVCNSCGGV